MDRSRRQDGSVFTHDLAEAVAPSHGVIVMSGRSGRVLAEAEIGVWRRRIGHADLLRTPRHDRSNRYRRRRPVPLIRASQDSR
jgi:ABC-type taurine transport system ATPase subunit